MLTFGFQHRHLLLVLDLLLLSAKTLLSQFCLSFSDFGIHLVELFLEHSSGTNRFSHSGSRGNRCCDRGLLGHRVRLVCLLALYDNRGLKFNPLVL
jgi:hypothetical protein